ncbi:hypothetical protein OPQ81_002836 [Rhizoctonia solani]|nr:hypothetical protein OPQ81_002836 [Rhizoctonia solani]
MKSITTLALLCIARLAAGQAVVVGDVQMVDASTETASGFALPASTVSSGAPMVTSPASVPSPTSAEATPTTTAAPNPYELMPYASMVSGGYSSMGCGYGYKKDDKGYCQPESWYSFGGCYETTIIVNHKPPSCHSSTVTHTATVTVTHTQDPAVTHTQQVTYTQTATKTEVVPTTVHVTQTETKNVTQTETQTQVVPTTVMVTNTLTEIQKETLTATATATATQVEFKTYTQTQLIPTTKVWVSTEIIDKTSVIEHTLTATMTQTQLNTVTATATATATATETQKETLTEKSTITELATVTQVHTQVVPTTYISVWVSTEVVDKTKIIEHTKSATVTSTATYLQTSTETQTATATATATATVTNHVTQVYTQVVPTTVTSVWVSTEIMDKTKTVEHTLTSVMTQTATLTQTSVETQTATATTTQTVQETALSSCLNMCTMSWSMPAYMTTPSTTTTHAMATSTPAHGCGSGGCVKQIVNPVLLDDLNRPNIGGLYDPALGPSERGDVCGTCRLNSFSCPGHFGHIELPSPVYHPLFMTNMLNLLRGVCVWCHQFKMADGEKAKYEAKLTLLERGLLTAASDVDEFSIRPGTKDEAGGEPGETISEFKQRLALFVKHHLKDAPAATRNDYKDGPVYQARKDVIQAFLRSAVGCKKCAHCDSFGYTYRKDGHTRIVEYDLSRKHKSIMEALGKVRPNVLLLERRTSQSTSNYTSEYSTSNRDQDGDVEMEDVEEPEPLGESTFEDGSRDNNELPRSVSGAVKTIRGRNERVLPPEEARAHLRRLFAREPKLTMLIYGRHGPFAKTAKAANADMFFLEVLPVPPTRFRPPARMGDSVFEHPQNELLTKVLVTAYRLRDLEAALREASKKPTEGNETDELEAAEEGNRQKLFGQLLEALIQLQIDVNSFMDSSKNPAPVRQGKLPTAGVKQGLEKKEGLFRKHMMGKRVNYAARSVISPDVNIETNEIGIPPVFARKLTFPEPVTSHNVKELRQAVINGTAVYPGASIVQNEDGGLVYLDRMEPDARAALAARLLTPPEGPTPNDLTHRDARGKTVYRHLKDGDILILNRQPTLHKPSMMAHRAKVLKGEKTIRMHYANCNSYNADFDGDEMNIHFAQNHVARSEAIHIANTDNQYLAATSGDPLRGLIQDHVVAGVWMTNKSTMFSREEYYQLLYGALRPENDYSGQGRVKTLPPAIWKPKPLWTGKQIISTLLLNITPPNAGGLTLTSKGKVGNEHWGPHSQEETVLICDGELLCGVLDKSQFGASSYGLVHSVYELYGAETAGRLLSILSRLFTKFLQHRAFTCRMDDLALTPEGDARRAKILQDAKTFGYEAAVENFPSLDGASPEECARRLPILLEEVLRDDAKMANLDLTVKKKNDGRDRVCDQGMHATRPSAQIPRQPHANDDHVWG